MTSKMSVLTCLPYDIALLTTATTLLVRRRTVCGFLDIACQVINVEFRLRAYKIAATLIVHQTEDSLYI